MRAAALLLLAAAVNAEEEDSPCAVVNQEHSSPTDAKGGWTMRVRVPRPFSPFAVVTMTAPRGTFIDSAADVAAYQISSDKRKVQLRLGARLGGPSYDEITLLGARTQQRLDSARLDVRAAGVRGPCTANGSGASPQLRAHGLRPSPAQGLAW